MSGNHEAVGREIAERMAELAREIVTCQYNREPEIWEPFGAEGLDKSIRDQVFHLQYLSEAIQRNQTLLFIDYLQWVRTLFEGLRFPARVLHTTLECTESVLMQEMEAGAHDVIRTFMAAGRAALTAEQVTHAGHISGAAPLTDLARTYLDALLAGDRHRATRLILDAVEQGTAVREIYIHVFQTCLYEIGRLWQVNQVSVAQEHFSTAVTQMIMSQLYPHIFAGERNGRRLVATCVGGELHEIGVRMVADFFEMAGWDTYYMGANTPASGVLQTVLEQEADLLGISATMTYHVGLVEDLIRQIRQQVGERVAILVGGYPFRVSATLWESVGADGCAADAQSAIEKANRLVAGG